MLPDDPRHGSNAGYQAHRRDDERPCAACESGRRRDRKMQSIEAFAGVRTLYSYDELLGAMEPWLALGLNQRAVADAAGIPNRGGKLFPTGRPVRRSTYLAIASFTDDTLISPRQTVWSYLTTQRIGSLMAAGHRLRDMPINERGQWRYRPRVSVDTARLIRDYYATHQHTDGPATHTRSRALAAGYRPPVAWDDPGTLAWPLGWTEPLVDVAYDEVVVARILNGDCRLKANRAERVEVLRRWQSTGRSDNALERLTGWKISRDVRPHLPREESAA